MPPKLKQYLLAALLAAAVLGTIAVSAPAVAATVVLDTGHTPSRPGARSALGRGEYEFNLRLSNEVTRLLARPGVSVQRVSHDGREVSLADRTAGTAGADLFVSIHHDSIQQAWIDQGRRGEFAGFSVFVSRKNPQALKSAGCALSVGRALAGMGERPSLYHATPVPGENRPLFDAAAGAHYFDDLIVLKTAKSAAILVEAGVIVNPQEESRLLTGPALESIARAISAGILACLSVR